VRNRKEVDVKAEVLIGESLRGGAESDFGFDRVIDKVAIGAQNSCSRLLAKIKDAYPDGN
jgi:hypothetical protein